MITLAKQAEPLVAQTGQGIEDEEGIAGTKTFEDDWEQGQIGDCHVALATL